MMADFRFCVTRRIPLGMVLLAGALLWSGCTAGELRGVAIDPPKAVPSFVFTRADGATFSTNATGDTLTVLFFGYTHCPDVCPTTLADWKRARQQLGTKAGRVRFVFVSIDPERDTPAVAQQYAAQFDSSFVGLSGTPDTISRMQQAFGAASYRDTAGRERASLDSASQADAYTMTHSSQVFLVNGKGLLVAMYSLGSGWDALATDLAQLL